MNLEQITALALAVGSIITALGALFNHLGNKKKIDFDRNRDSVTEWKEIANTYKQDYGKLMDRLEELETTVEESNNQHQSDRELWRREQQELVDENTRLTKRVSLLEDALIDKGVDISTI